MKHRIGSIVPVAVAVAVLAVSLGGATARSRDATRCEIFADRMWQPTAVQLEDGYGIVISARGTWSHGREAGFEPHYDADGFKKLDSTALLPRVWVGTLLGRIGDGRPFPIGERLGILVQSEGQLWLTMNDVPGHFANNSGSLDVWIDLHSRPRPRGTAAEPRGQ